MQKGKKNWNFKYKSLIKRHCGRWWWLFKVNFWSPLGCIQRPLQSFSTGSKRLLTDIKSFLLPPGATYHTRCVNLPCSMVWIIISNTVIEYYVFVILAWGMIYLQPCISASPFFFFFFPPCPLCIFFLLNGLTLAASGFSMVFNVLVRWQSLLSLFRVVFHPDVLREACFYFCIRQKVLREACEQASGDVYVPVCPPASIAGRPGCFRQELR